MWVQLERPDRRKGPTEERLLICTDPGLPATEIITGYAKRFCQASRQNARKPQ